MNTTVMIIEIISSGYIALIWLFIIIFNVFNCNFNLVIQNTFFITTAEKLIPIISVASIVVAYQIGWILDHIAYIISYYLIPPIKIKNGFRLFYGFGRRIKNNKIENDHFWNYYVTIYSTCSDSFKNELDIDMNLVRFSRCLILNIIMIIVCIVIFKPLNSFDQYIFIISGLFIIGIFSFITLKLRWTSMFDKMSEYFILYNKNMLKK